ncbi:hypothetical protein ACS0TY_005153 [Phlomoides rotata]
MFGSGRDYEKDLEYYSKFRRTAWCGGGGGIEQMEKTWARLQKVEMEADQFRINSTYNTLEQLENYKNETIQFEQQRAINQVRQRVFQQALQGAIGTLNSCLNNELHLHTISANIDINILCERIEQYNREVKIVNTGTVLQVGDGIARIYGLDEVMAGTIGIALNLESNNVGVVLMGDGLMIQEGSSVKAIGRIAQIPVSEAYLGRVINALAKPIDGPHSNNKECVKLLAGVETAAVKKLQSSK